jgi:AAA+ superfamily predicted ATPase
LTGSFADRVVVEFSTAQTEQYFPVIKTNIANDKTLVVVNPESPIPLAFHAGEIPVPSKMVRKVLNRDFHVKLDHIPELQTALNGLTLKEITEVCSLSQVIHEELTPKSVRRVRRTVTQVVPGVQSVPAQLEHYALSEEVVKWTHTTGQFLHSKEHDYRLRPRGLLFDGVPGTGKTLASKYIAASLNVNLFRLDIGALQSKYVGESEANLNRALSVVSQNEPCVMLIDEVEKLFHGTDDSGVTANLLATLLWWLQEHRYRVLTIMTTNDREKLPDELVRPGRIDQVITFGLLEPDDIDEYVLGLLDSLGIDEEGTIEWSALPSKPIAHADLTGLVLRLVREYLLDGEKT